MTQQRWKHRPDGSNWGDFGPDDQVGRMNLITDAHRVTAAKEVRTGRAFCLSLPLDLPGGEGFTERRRAPVFTTPLRDGFPNYNWRASRFDCCDRSVSNDDTVTLSPQFSTQWDALCHNGQEFDADGDGVEEIVYYNGYRGGEHILGPDDGGPRARALGIETLAVTGVQGRGVLIDAFSTYGRSRARLGYDEVMRLVDDQKIEIETGDFLCLYTGLADLILEMGQDFDRQAVIASCSVINGRDERLLKWIDDAGVVAICSDNIAVEWGLRTLREGERARLPLHEMCLFKLGIHIGELWYFGELAPWLRANGRSRFMLTAPPLRLPGAVGSPVTPIATV